MIKPTNVLPVLPALLLFAIPAAGSDYRGSRHAKVKILRLADEVSDGARAAYRSAAGYHDPYRGLGYVYRGHRYGGARHDAVDALSDLEHRARSFERALAYRPLYRTHREYEALTRAFDRAADAVYRARLGHRVMRDFDCVAEYMYSLSGVYEEYAYPRRIAHRRGGYEHRNRVEVYAPRWNVDLEWRLDDRRRDGRFGQRRFGDEDSDSY